MGGLIMRVIMEGEDETGAGERNDLDPSIILLIGF